MKTKEEILREYVKFDDVNGNDTVQLLPLTITGAMEEYASQFQKQESKGLSLEECKNRITQEYGLGQFYVLMKGSSEKRIDEAIEKVATLYLQSNKGWSDDKWVSVEDSPKTKGYYIVHLLFPNGRQEVTKMWFGDRDGDLFWDDFHANRITHWQPLPAPPKSLTENK